MNGDDKEKLAEKLREIWMKEPWKDGDEKGDMIDIYASYITENYISVVDRPWLRLYEDYDTVWAALKTTGRKPEQMVAEISRLKEIEYEYNHLEWEKCKCGVSQIKPATIVFNKEHPLPRSWCPITPNDLIKEPQEDKPLEDSPFYTGKRIGEEAKNKPCKHRLREARTIEYEAVCLDCPAKKIVKCGIDKQGIEMVSIKPKDKPREPHEVGCMCPFCVPSVEQPSPLPPIEKIVRVDPPNYSVLKYL